MNISSSSSSSLFNDGIISSTISFVQNELKDIDASHDWAHIERVWKLAKAIAEEEIINGNDDIDIELVQLGALLHDIKDWKYVNKENVKKIETAGEEIAQEWLLLQNYPLERIERVKRIIEGVGFKNELDRKLSFDKTEYEVFIVQDADRIDAIGAIGIARTFTFGGIKNRPFIGISEPTDMCCKKEIEKNIKVITKKEYMEKTEFESEKKEQTPGTINHFYEKLLRLKGMMKTPAGKRIAEKRHNVMVDFLMQFYDEWNGRS